MSQRSWDQKLFVEYVNEKDLPVTNPFRVLALPIFPCRQSIVPAELGPELHIIICKKSACRWQADFLCWRYLSSCVGKVLSRRSRDQKPSVEFVNEKDLPVASPFLVLALPIFLCRQSIVPAEPGPEAVCRICKRKGLAGGKSFSCVGVTYLPVQSPAKYCRRR